jgi:hypothetical protein
LATVMYAFEWALPMNFWPTRPTLIVFAAMNHPFTSLRMNNFTEYFRY